MKNKVAEKQPSSAKELVNAIKNLGERNQHRVAYCTFPVKVYPGILQQYCERNVDTQNTKSNLFFVDKK